MKKIHLTSTFLLFSFLTFSQNYYNISFEGNGINENDDRHELYRDTISNANCIWQIGSPDKTVFTSAYTQPNAIITDTTNSYPSNDQSSFIIEHEANAGFSMPYNFEVRFGGYYYVNSDTLTDYGKIEFSPDNGNTWIDLQDPNYANEINWSSEFESPVLSGNSNGWRKFEAELHQLGPLFNIQSNDIVLFKFSFFSDGIQTNKDGLMYDSLYIWDVPPVSISNINENQFQIYPNPSNTAVSISAPINLGNVKIVICTIVGEVILEERLNLDKNTAFDIKELSSGTYMVKLFDEDGEIIWNQSLVKL